jgi:hypothetical protein
MHEQNFEKLDYVRIKYVSHISILKRYSGLSLQQQ